MYIHVLASPKWFRRLRELGRHAVELLLVVLNLDLSIFLNKIHLGEDDQECISMCHRS